MGTAMTAPPSVPVERTATCAGCGSEIAIKSCSWCNGLLCLSCCDKKGDPGPRTQPSVPEIQSTGLHPCKTVAELKAVLATWPDVHSDGSPTRIRVPVGTGYLNTIWVMGINPRINGKDEVAADLCVYTKQP